MEAPNTSSYDDILDILRQFVDELDSCETITHCNERYLHHYFSHKLQSKYEISFDGKSLIHPEWATAKKGTARNAKYKEGRKHYLVDQTNGTSGFIDLAVGNLDNPEIAIEFKMSESLDTKGIEYDYLKLLDGRNPFTKSVSIVVLYGRKSKSMTIYSEHLPSCVKDAVQRLNENGIQARSEFAFFVIEFFNGNAYIHRCETQDGVFKEINKNQLYEKDFI